MLTKNYHERSCGTCGMCCKLPVVEELDKPRNKWCVNASVGAGCKIYDARPSTCRAFNCEWLVNPQLGDAWKPDRSKFYIARDGNVLNVRIPIQSGHRFRFEVGHRSDLKPATWAGIRLAVCSPRVST